MRTWLAGQVAQYKVGANPDFASYTQALASMLSYARMVGLPPGDPKAGAAVVIDPLGNVAFSASAGGGGSLLSLRERPPPTKPADAPGNNCNVCDSWWCTALARASSAAECKAHCVCAPDSSFDAAACSKGSAYITSRRTFWAANPNLTTLKGLKLKVNTDGTVSEAPSSGGKGGGRGRGRGNGRGRGRGSLHMLGNGQPVSAAEEQPQSEDTLTDDDQHQPNDDQPDEQQANDLISKENFDDGQVVENEQAFEQRPDETFEQWLTRHEHASPSLSMIIGASSKRAATSVRPLPSSGVVFREDNLVIIDDDLVPTHYYKPDNSDETFDRQLALIIEDDLTIESNAATAEQLRLDLELARSIACDMEMESQAVLDDQLQLDHAVAQSLSHDLNGSHASSSQLPSTHDEFEYCPDGVPGCLCGLCTWDADEPTDATTHSPTSLKQSRQPNSVLLGGTLMMLRGDSSSKDKALDAVAEDDEADDDDEGSINDVEQPSSDGSAAGEAAQISLRALREAQAALTQRELQFQQLKEDADNLHAKQRQDADLIAQLRQQLKSQPGTSVATPSKSTASILGTTPSTRSPYVQHHASQSPSLNPALVSADAMRASTPPSGHGEGGAHSSKDPYFFTSADAMRATTPSGHGEGGAHSSKDPTSLRSPMPSLFTIGGDKDKRTINEDLAHAMLLNERQLRQAKSKDKRSAILGVMLNTLSTAMSAVTTGVTHFDHRQWTFIIILAQY